MSCNPCTFSTNIESTDDNWKADHQKLEAIIRQTFDELEDSKYIINDVFREIESNYNKYKPSDNYSKTHWDHNSLMHCVRRIGKTILVNPNTSIRTQSLSLGIIFDLSIQELNDLVEKGAKPVKDEKAWHNSVSVALHFTGSHYLDFLAKQQAQPNTEQNIHNSTNKAIERGCLDKFLTLFPKAQPCNTHTYENSFTQAFKNLNKVRDIKELFRMEASPCNRSKGNTLTAALQNGYSEEIIELLMKNNALFCNDLDFTSCLYQYNNSLHAAICSRKYTDLFILFLIEKGALPNHNTLHQAVKYKYSKTVIEALIKNSKPLSNVYLEDINHIANTLDKALENALPEDCVELLLDAGAIASENSHKLATKGQYSKAIIEKISDTLKGK